MIATNVTTEQLEEALRQTNVRYGGNLRFRDIRKIGRSRVRFTLTVQDSGDLGGRRSASAFHPNRKVAAACWHAHGNFFDHLWEIAPDAVIRAGTLTMHGPDDNWQDRNIGSMMYPMYFSEACECDGSRGPVHALP